MVEVWTGIPRRPPDVEVAETPSFITAGRIWLGNCPFPDNHLFSNRLHSWCRTLQWLSVGDSGRGK
ncbi:hypothetical protein J6590_078692 [Homalodisca vitripennis]|nr:hypothetical protein J6590_078692 [Homalodisca vitripennis]